MSHDVATNWLLWVDSVRHGTTWVRSHLIGQEDSHVELLSNLLQSTHDSVENLLTLSKLTTSRVVHTERCHDRVDHEQREAVLNHLACSLHQQIDQAVHSEGPTNHDVVEDALRVKVESIRDLPDALWPERVLCVDEENFALAATLRARQLCRNTERMTQLCLAGPELSEGLRDGHALNATLQ